MRAYLLSENRSLSIKCTRDTIIEAIFPIDLIWGKQGNTIV